MMVTDSVGLTVSLSNGNGFCHRRLIVSCQPDAHQCQRSDHKDGNGYLPVVTVHSTPN